MERQTEIPPEILDPSTPEYIETLHQKVQNLIKGAQKNLRFYVMRGEHPAVIIIGIRGQYYGFRIFDAYSQQAVASLQEEGQTLVENPMEMILKSETATIAEIERRLPAFLKKFHPELTKVIDRQSIKISKKFK